MTAATVVFDPFSQDFFTDPYDIYRRMREEAPVYYSEHYDFYALTRHEDVAAAYKDHESYSSAYGVDLGQVRKGVVTEHGSIIAMDPPVHRRMRSLLNKVFTPRAIQAHRGLVASLIEKHLSAVENLGLGYGIHSCLGAALARMETAIALDKMLDFMPRYEVDWDGCKRVNMQNVAGWSHVPVRVLN
jgi:cytochrome P450